VFCAPYPLFEKLVAKFGTVLVIVDQPANIGALPLAVARDAGCQVAYLPGLAMRRAAEMYEGEAKTDARDADHLASYAGLAPVTKSSGSSIRGEHAPRCGNRQLKRAMFLSAFAALGDRDSRAYYDKQRAAGKTHTQAILRLARRRINVLYAMLRDGAFYASRTLSV
jgi:transposase